MNTNTLTNTNTKVINEVFTAMETGKFDVAGTKISDNFSATLFGKKVNKSEYLHSYRSLLQGIPDMKFNLQDVKQEGDRVTARVTFSGTNSKAIPSLMSGWKEVAPTGKKIDGFVSDLEITLKGDRIEEIKNVHAEKGMIIGLLNRLGLDYTKYQAN